MIITEPGSDDQCHPASDFLKLCSAPREPFYIERGFFSRTEIEEKETMRKTAYNMNVV